MNYVDEGGGLETSVLDNREFTSTPTLKNSAEKPTLHDILLAEKIDFEAKVQRAARRKKWLQGININYSLKIIIFFFIKYVL